MSVTGTYMLILGKDYPSRDSEEREQYDIERSKNLMILDRSTVELALAVDSVDWDGDKPTIGKLYGNLTYFWWDTIGPYYKESEGVFPSLEGLIASVKERYPQLDQHYALIVWIEGELQRIDGYFLERNIHYNKTILVPENEYSDWVDIRVCFRNQSKLTSDYKNP